MCAWKIRFLSVGSCAQHCSFQRLEIVQTYIKIEPIVLFWLERNNSLLKGSKPKIEDEFVTEMH